jgi:hypothetical protein
VPIRCASSRASRPRPVASCGCLSASRQPEAAGARAGAGRQAAVGRRSEGFSSEAAAVAWGKAQGWLPRA